MELARLRRLSFFQGMPRWALVRLAGAATEEELPAGGMVLRQSDRARAVHFLLAGSVQILIQVGEEDLLVAVLRRAGELRVLAGDGSVVCRRKAVPTVESMTEVEQAAVAGAAPGTRLEVVLEPTGPAWLPIAVFFPGSRGRRNTGLVTGV
jgi:hypothetical protein